MLAVLQTGTWHCKEIRLRLEDGFLYNDMYQFVKNAWTIWTFWSKNI